MKQTVEEAAREYYEIFKIHLAKDIFRPRVIDIFKAGAEWQAKQSLWISVKERLPEEDGYYFVTDGDVVEKVYFFKRWNKFVSTRDYPHLFYDEGVIKAWLPIPSFDEILEANRDVLERIKEKGE
jgi:hypothetical protein|nr:MAG TPA: Protein of unknown function (DUF551) [Caudoviricetes sp.]